MTERVSIPQCVAILTDLLAEQEDGSLEHCALDDSIYRLRWMHEKLAPVADILPDVIRYRDAIAKHIADLKRAELAPESAQVRERWPDAEIHGLTDPDLEPQQMEMLDP